MVVRASDHLGLVMERLEGVPDGGQNLNRGRRGKSNHFHLGVLGEGKSQWLMSHLFLY